MAVEPISPNDIPLAKIKMIPDFVIEIFNRLIIGSYLNGKAFVYQQDVIAAIKIHNEHFTTNDILTAGWLDVEPLYEAAGWTVKYDKPVYNETYKPFFEFTKK